MWITALTSLIGGVFGVGEKYVDGKNKVREAKISAEVARWAAKATAYENDAQRTHSWEVEALKLSQFSWKDEFWTIILGVLLLSPMCFSLAFVFTGNEQYREASTAMWATYGAMPLVFQFIYPAVILASMGMRYKGKSDAANSIKSVIDNKA